MMFLLSDNSVLMTGYAYPSNEPQAPPYHDWNDTKTRKLDPALGAWTALTSDSGFRGGSAVLHYKNGVDEIIKAGAAIVSCDPVFYSKRAARFRALPLPGEWVSLPDMNHGRNHCYLIALPDGRTLVEGGRIDQFIPPPCTLDPANTPQPIPPEIYDPYDLAASNGAWKSMAAPIVARGYHHSAVLLPDGSVFVAGGGHFPDYKRDETGQDTYEIYKPPYFFSSTPRPVIADCPVEITYGRAFNVEIGTPAPTIAKVRLIRLGTATHSFDMEQRLVELSFTELTGQTPGVRTVAPTHGGIAPPGYYMLFMCTDPSGAPVQHGAIPSISRIVRLS